MRRYLPTCRVWPIVPARPSTATPAKLSPIGPAPWISAAIDMLRDNGPAQGRPLVDTVKAATSLNNLKELRPGSSGSSEVRILFVFDPRRRAVYQSRVSQIERQSLDDTVLSTLAAYVEALGGRVRVVADFGDELVVLSRITAGTPDTAPADTGPRKRDNLAEELRAKYEAGRSIRALADESGLSYGFVHRTLSESGVVLRRRGGSRKKPSPRAMPNR